MSGNEVHPFLPLSVTRFVPSFLPPTSLLTLSFPQSLSSPNSLPPSLSSPQSLPPSLALPRSFLALSFPQSPYSPNCRTSTPAQTFIPSTPAHWRPDIFHAHSRSSSLLPRSVVPSVPLFPQFPPSHIFHSFTPGRGVVVGAGAWGGGGKCCWWDGGGCWRREALICMSCSWYCR
jgi:hypothetical protein